MDKKAVKSVCKAYNNPGKRVLSTLIVLILLCSCAGCGKGGQAGGMFGNLGGKETGQSTPGDVIAAEQNDETALWTCEPQDLKLEVPGAVYYTAQLQGEFLYLQTKGEAEQNGAEGISRVSLKDGSVQQVVPDRAGENLHLFEVLEDGSVYVVAELREEGSPTANTCLIQYDPTGAEKKRVELAELMNRERVDYFERITADSRGRVALAADGRVFLWDENGQETGIVEVGSARDGTVTALGSGKDGKVYVCGTDGGAGGTLTEIDRDEKTVEASYRGLPWNSGSRLSAAGEKAFFLFDGTVLYRYDVEKGEAKRLFQLISYGIDSMEVRLVGMDANGKILVVTEDSGGKGGSVITLSRVADQAGLTAQENTQGSGEQTGQGTGAQTVPQTEQPAVQAPEKEPITLGVLYANSNLKKAVANFNKNNESYRIVIREYGKNGKTLEEVRARVNADLVSDNCPDILSLEGLNAGELARKGAFEDLGAYLEQSGTLKAEDYPENVLESCTFDGKLVAVPKGFYIYTLVGYASDVGAEKGWTLDGLIAVAQAHPDAVLFRNGGRQAIMECCLKFNQREFVDRDAGKCYFDSPEFIELLEFVKGYPETVPDTEDSWTTRIQKGEILFSTEEINDFDEVQYFNEIFRGEASFVGYPTQDGSAGYELSPTGCLAISSRTDKKEVAWEFLEGYLGMEQTAEGKWKEATSPFPSRWAELNNLYEETLRVTYKTDENGDPVYENGQLVITESVQGKYPLVCWMPDDWSYQYRPTVREEADAIYEIIRAAKPASETFNTEIYVIISEEADVFYKGGKTAEETARVIQNRVQLYLDEN